MSLQRLADIDGPTWFFGLLGLLGAIAIAIQTIYTIRRGFAYSGIDFSTGAWTRAFKSKDRNKYRAAIRLQILGVAALLMVSVLAFTNGYPIK
jgi:hypothetical protein